ncbi:Heavy metal RND efflux outer membrane protein, CzcC family [Variovorax sp. WDL1]|nr:Heavy metal RND efflux outer membrane protein, CzcC family [Variovorax sp. WDL1]
MTLFEARHAEVEVQRKRLTLQRDLAKVQAQLAFRPLSSEVSP